MTHDGSFVVGVSSVVGVPVVSIVTVSDGVSLLLSTVGSDKVDVSLVGVVSDTVASSVGLEVGVMDVELAVVTVGSVTVSTA